MANLDATTPADHYFDTAVRLLYECNPNKRIFEIASLSSSLIISGSTAVAAYLLSHSIIVEAIPLVGQICSSFLRSWPYETGESFLRRKTAGQDFITDLFPGPGIAEPRAVDIECAEFLAKAGGLAPGRVRSALAGAWNGLKRNGDVAVINAIIVMVNLVPESLAIGAAKLEKLTRKKLAVANAAEIEAIPDATPLEKPYTLRDAFWDGYEQLAFRTERSMDTARRSVAALVRAGVEPELGRR